MRRGKARSNEAIEFARRQRALANEFASTVWQWLRNRQCHGQKFRREYPIPPYTADFCCVELKFIVEIDGEQHGTAAGRAHDVRRDSFLEGLGYQVLRLAGYDVAREDGGALRRIEEAVKRRMESYVPPQPLTPSPSPRGGERGAREEAGSMKKRFPIPKITGTP